MVCPSHKHSDTPSDAKTTPNRARFWRSLNEWQQTDDFDQYLHREFPVAASEIPQGVSRRRWLQIMGASLAMAGTAGCRYPEELIAPFVLRPENRIPGERYERATNFELAGRVYNLLVSCVDGRPLKIEPNNDHPSGGGTDAFSQAAILSLYDPDRSRGDDGPALRKEENGRRFGADWDEFATYGQAMVRTAAGNGDGKSLGVLIGPTHSPSQVRMIAKLKESMPSATIVRFDGVTDGVMDAATKLAFGKPGKQVLDLSRAKVIVTLQADILGNDSGFLQNAASFAENRNPLSDDGMSRLYAVEGGYTQTGAAADSRLSLRPSQMPALLAEIGRRVESMKAGESHDHASEDKAFDELDHEARLERFIDAIAHDLSDAGDGEAVVVVGEHLGAEAVAAGIRMNETLGSLGKLQSFVTPADATIQGAATLQDLVAKMDAGEIDSLLVLGGNPVYASPSDIDVAGAIAKVENTVYAGEYDNETAVLCDWSVPVAHPLESWGDVVAADGSYGVCQPQILPLLDGKTECEILAIVMDEQETSGELIVRQTADQIAGQALSNREWRTLLHDGYADAVKVPAGDFALSGDAPDSPADAPVAVSQADQDDIEVIFQPADGIYDGRFANNGWLQELPQAITKLTWDNAAMMSPSTAATLKVSHGSMVAIRKGDALLTLPVYELPGCAPGVITTSIGYGRERAGMVGGWAATDVEQVGVDVSPIRTSDSMLVAYKMEARPRYVDYDLATTQDHWAIDELGRDEAESRSFTLVREGTLDLLERLPKFAEAKGPHVPKVGTSGSLWEEPIDVIEETKESLPQWGMSIDLTKCIGCNACVVACQSENNIPIVGKEQVLNSREMHWLRIDRYFQGDPEFADVVQEPVACMHCETAPCEQVCPVAATVHTDEGINAMAYNRCIGTRYCANNCPFKVRRFNYFNYNEDVGVGYGVESFAGAVEDANRKLQTLVLNPDVTVRGRGVMEKCTYCVQRVEAAKITVRKEGGRPIVDGDVITACQAACPTNAVEFGNIADPESKVAQAREDVRKYALLEQLNLKNRTTFLARVRNTPKSLMTTRQLKDLASLEMRVHHHEGGGHESDGDHGDGHGGEESHDEHAEGHGDDHASTRMQLPIISLS